MHIVTISGTEYDLCTEAVAALFDKRQIVVRSGITLLLRDYSEVSPNPRRAGSVAYRCDVHGATSNCP